VPDPRYPLFFVSYPHSSDRLPPTGRPKARGQHVVQFFDDLSEHLVNLVPRAAGADPGFLDRQLQGGEEWRPELLHALGTCNVFVPLLSAPYFTSKWCGMEWDGFSQREVTVKAPTSDPQKTAIVPVIWAPLLSGTEAPPVVDAVQRFIPSGLPDPNVAEHYRRDGVYGLMVTKQEDAYQMVVWRLAQRIAALCQSHEVAIRAFEPGDLSNVFQEEIS
jgi:hypothetical protein